MSGYSGVAESIFKTFLVHEVMKKIADTFGYFRQKAEDVRKRTWSASPIGPESRTERLRVVPPVSEDAR